MCRELHRRRGGRSPLGGARCVGGVCGSAVTYREQTKTEWLGVDPATIDAQTAVSEEVAVQMAVGVLSRTPEAHVAISLTGHLGPGAPPSQDGIVFVALATRRDAAARLWQVQRLQLSAGDRAGRRTEAVARGLEALERVLAGHT